MLFLPADQVIFILIFACKHFLNYNLHWSRLGLKLQNKKVSMRLISSLNYTPFFFYKNDVPSCWFHSSLSDQFSTSLAEIYGTVNIQRGFIKCVFLHKPVPSTHKWAV